MRSERARGKDITQIGMKRKLRVLMTEERTENRDNGETERVPKKTGKLTTRLRGGRNILSMGNISRRAGG